MTHAKGKVRRRARSRAMPMDSVSRVATSITGTEGSRGWERRVCRPWWHAEHNVNHTLGAEARIQWTELCTSGRCRRGDSSPHTPAMRLVCKGQGRDVADALWNRVADVQLPHEHTLGRSSSPGFSLNIHHLWAWFIHKLGFPFIFLQRPHWVYPGIKFLKAVSVHNSSANGYLNKRRGFGNDLGALKNKFAAVTLDVFVLFFEGSLQVVSFDSKKTFIPGRELFFSHICVFNFIVSPIHSY